MVIKTKDFIVLTRNLSATTTVSPTVTNQTLNPVTFNICGSVHHA